MEIRELLSKYEYDGDDAIFVKGSALAASNDTDPELGEKKILELLKVMDETIPIPERPIDKDFMMSVDSTFTVPGRGTVVTGTIEQGKIKVGEDVEIVGYHNSTNKTTVTGKSLSKVLRLLKKHWIMVRLGIIVDYYLEVFKEMMW